MENTKIDICLCTGGTGQTKDLLIEQLLPISHGDLYVKYSESELISKSDNFRCITIPNLPISIIQEAVQHLCGHSDSFINRVLKHLKGLTGARQTVCRCSSYFTPVFEGEVDLVSLGILKTPASCYLSVSRILYHMSASEEGLWNTLCSLANPHRTTFEFSMRSFLDNDPMTIEDMAKEMKLSLTYFKNKCTEYLGTTPHKWIITQQLHRAYIDVITTDYSVNKIAERAKFDNVSHFIKLFKREFLTTPLQLRYSLRTSVTV